MQRWSIVWLRSTIESITLVHPKASVLLKASLTVAEKEYLARLETRMSLSHRLTRLCAQETNSASKSKTLKTRSGSTRSSQTSMWSSSSKTLSSLRRSRNRYSVFMLQLLWSACRRGWWRIRVAQLLCREICSLRGPVARSWSKTKATLSCPRSSQVQTWRSQARLEIPTLIKVFRASYSSRVWVRREELPQRLDSFLKTTALQMEAWLQKKVMAQSKKRMSHRTNL